MIKKIGIIFGSFGIYPHRTVLAILGLPIFIKHLLVSFWLNHGEWKISLFPILADRFEESGIASGHYFHQDLWAARRVHFNTPNIHVDVGSRLDGFVAHLLTFREVTVVDVRPLHSRVAGLKFVQANMMDSESLPNMKSDSVSCLHAIEHFGLGRYGDPLDLKGWEKGIVNLAALLLPGGRLYLSVPVGRERVEFNAHRVFSPRTILGVTDRLGLSLVEFSYVDDAGDFHEKVTHEKAGLCEYGCGCFEFVSSTIVN